MADNDPPQVGSDRGFGFVFVVVFALVAVWPLTGSGELRLWAAIVAGVLLLITLVWPSLLRPFNKVWHRFGLLLHRFISPIVLGLLFFVAITPIALLVRVLGKDLLSMKLDRDGQSYWIHRSPPGPANDSLGNQY